MRDPKEFGDILDRAGELVFDDDVIWSKNDKRMLFAAILFDIVILTPGEETEAQVVEWAGADLAKFVMGLIGAIAFADLEHGGKDDKD
jgi:hypothetical protein